MQRNIMDEENIFEGDSLVLDGETMGIESNEYVM